MAAVGILAALHERERSGEGQVVDISMTDGALSWLAMVVARYFAEQKVPRRGEPELAGGIACYFPYETKDEKWVSLGALEPKFWQNWCNGAGRPDLIEKQFEHPDSEAGAEIAAVFRERTRDEWTAFAGEHDCCLEPILDLDEVLDSELVRARGMVVELDQPGIGPVKQVGAPIKLSRTPADTTRRRAGARRRHGRRAARDRHRPAAAARGGRGVNDASGNGLLRMRELAEAAGVSAGTIKHYLREGLLPEPVKTSRNMAWYPREFVERVRLIKQLQEERFLPLKVIREVLEQGEDEGGSDRLRALIELEDRVLERALSGQDSKGLSAGEVAERYGLPEDALDRLEKLEVLTPGHPQRLEALRAGRRADHRGGQPHARVGLLGGARLHRLRHADLQAPPRAARERGGRGDDGARGGGDGHRGRRPSCSSARSSRCATWSPPCAQSCSSRSCRRAARRSSPRRTVDLSIAAAVEADHDELFDLYALVVEEGGAFPREPPADEATFRETWIDGKTGVYVARSEGALAGSYHLLPNFGGLAAHIANAGYMVVPGFRRRGVGTALVEHSLDEARRLGFDAMMFNLVMESNPSRRLYERLGFEVGGTRARCGRRGGRDRLLAPALSDRVPCRCVTTSASGRSKCRTAQPGTCVAMRPRAHSRQAAETCGASSRRAASEWSPRYASANRPIVTPWSGCAAALDRIAGADVALLHDPQVRAGAPRRREALQERRIAHPQPQLEAREARLAHLEQRRADPPALAHDRLRRRRHR